MPIGSSRSNVVCTVPFLYKGRIDTDLSSTTATLALTSCIDFFSRDILRTPFLRSNLPLASCTYASGTAADTGTEVGAGGDT